MDAKGNPLDGVDKETLRARANLFNLAFVIAVQRAAQELSVALENRKAESAIAAELVTQSADLLAEWPIAGELENDRPLVLAQLQNIADAFSGAHALGQIDPDQLH